MAQQQHAFSRLRLPIVDVKTAMMLLLVAVFALVVVGAIMVFSSTSASLSSAGENPFTDMIQQLGYVGIGIFFMLALWFAIPYRALMSGYLLWGYYFFCMLLLLLTFFVGTEVNGAKRWLTIGPIGFQPSEFIKIALLMMTIRIMYDSSMGAINQRAGLSQFLILVALPLAFMLFTQSDLGSVAICFVGIFAVLWLGGMPGKWLAIIGGVTLVGGLLMIFGVGYRSSRMVFLNPWDDGEGGLGFGYNIIHAYYAIAEGGLFGQGIGSSSEKYGYLFASDSDFIFAIIAEELGMVGCIAVIGFFLVILYAGLRIAAECPDNFGKMVAGGFAIMLVFQAFLNIGCTIGVFPTTGKPLPFISSGGSSVISSMMIVGMILSVGKGTQETNDPKRQRDNLRVVRNTSNAGSARHAGHGRSARNARNTQR